MLLAAAITTAPSAENSTDEDDDEEQEKEEMSITQALELWTKYKTKEGKEVSRLLISSIFVPLDLQCF